MSIFISPVQPPRSFTSRLKLMGYQISPTLDADGNPQGQTCVDPLFNGVITVGRYGRTAWGLDLNSQWTSTSKNAVKATVVEPYASSLFNLPDNKAAVQAIYADADGTVWSVAGDDYAVGGGMFPCLSFNRNNKTYGPWAIDVGYTRSRHFINRVLGKLVVGAGVGSGSVSSPWGLGLSFVEEPNESTPLTQVLKTTTLAFTDINHRLMRAGDYTVAPNQNATRYPQPVNGLGAFLPTDETHAFTPIGDDVLLFMSGLGNGEVGYKYGGAPGDVSLEAGTTWAQGQLRYRSEWYAVWTNDALQVASGQRQPWAVQPFERIDPVAAFGLELPFEGLVQSATMLSPSRLLIAMHRPNGPVVYALFSVDPW